MNREPLAELSGVTKRYGKTVALDGITLFFGLFAARRLARVG